MSASKPDFQEMRRRYLDAQLQGDRRAALALVDGLLAEGASIGSLRREVVQWAQREIGDLWQLDRISVAQEHSATAISQVVLAHLFHRSPLAASRGQRIVIACVPGELHEFPARLMADALDAAGYDTHFLGADVPLAALLHEIERRPPDLLALSLTMQFNLASLFDTLAAVRRAAPLLMLAVGGRAIDESSERWAELGVAVAARDAETMIPALDALLRRAA